MVLNQVYIPIFLPCQKCQLRRKAVGIMPWSESKKAQTYTILKPDFMSDEETYVDGGTRRRRILQIPWESDELKTIKQELDHVIPDILSQREWETQLPCVRSAEHSNQKIPTGAPSWCLRQ